MPVSWYLKRRGRGDSGGFTAREVVVLPLGSSVGSGVTAIVWVVVLPLGE